jgi:hypothetical protein
MGRREATHVERLFSCNVCVCVRVCLCLCEWEEGSATASFSMFQGRSQPSSSIPNAVRAGLRNALRCAVLQEHNLYPRCVAALCDGRITWREDGVPIMWTPQ